MPMYSYECSKCAVERELIVSYEERNHPHKCSACGTPMERLLDAPKLGKPAYQMKAVMGNGEHVKGHFGKTAKRNKK